MSARLLVLLAVAAAASLGAAAAAVARDPPVPAPVNHYCFDGTYANGSLYQKNLDDLVSALSAAAADSGNGGFHSGSVGAAPPDQASGLIMCYADATVAQCTECLRNASSAGGGVCPGSRGVSVIYGDHGACVLRYAAEPILGAADNSTFLMSEWTVAPDGADVASLNATRSRLLAVLAARAAGQPLRLASGSLGYTDARGEAQVVYGLAQCTRDLPPGQCAACLADNLDRAVPGVMDNSTAGSVKGFSCYARFQLNQPIVIIPGLLAAGPPAPAPAPPQP